MVLSAGARLGAYEILAPLGAGGMGEVYRARDTALNREVAIKVLPEAFAGDADRLARFSREAQTLAALNHPNIAQIHGLEASGPVHALVMELMAGDDLSTIIARGPIPPADALPLARQIVAALEAAHGLGIVHRDLKPANIKVRHDGTVKVLDFGLAKAMEPGGASGGDLMNSPTITARGTELGTILGTAAYMAPEQAKGRPGDTRADIWAFGVIGFEMLTGKALFAGETISDTLAAVLREEIDWTTLPASTSDRIRRLLARCLHRDVTQRLQAIGEARIILDATDEPAGVVRPDVPRQPPRSAIRRAAPWAAAALLAVAAAAGGWWLGRAGTPAPVVTRLSITLPVPLSPNHETANVALSRDGRTLAYVGVHNGMRGLYVRALDQPEVRLLAGTERAAGPVFSPDGAWLAFKDDFRMKKMPVLGGSPALVNEGNPDSLGADWAPRRHVAFRAGVHARSRARARIRRHRAGADAPGPVERREQLSVAAPAAGREGSALRHQSRQQRVLQRGAPCRGVSERYCTAQRPRRAGLVSLLRTDRPSRLLQQRLGAGRAVRSPPTGADGTGRARRRRRICCAAYRSGAGGDL
jgi:hypothetical protein